MELLRITILIIFLVIGYVLIPKFVNYVQRKPDKKMDINEFVLSKPKALSWMWASGFLAFLALVSLILFQGGIPDDPWWFYVIIISIALGIILYLIRLIFYRLKVENGHFHYRPVFGSKRDFNVTEIKKVEHTKDMDGVSKIILHSEKGELVKIDSSLKGYATFIKFLRENELID